MSTAGRVHHLRAHGDRPPPGDLLEAAAHRRAHAVLPVPDLVRAQVHPLGVRVAPRPQAFERAAQRCESESNTQSRI